ncbi:MAG: hypothetical protein ACK5F7_06030, partial [Planctomycetaceae bacterium]
MTTLFNTATLHNRPPILTGDFPRDWNETSRAGVKANTVGETGVQAATAPRGEGLTRVCAARACRLLLLM